MPTVTRPAVSLPSAFFVAEKNTGAPALRSARSAGANVTTGVEYRHTDVGSHTVNFGSGGPNGVSERARLGFTDDAVLARVNLKFSAVQHMF